MAEAGELLPDLTLCKDSYEAAEGADAIVLATEWNQFRMLDWERIKRLVAEPVLVDLRNVYKPREMRASGIEYVSVGR
jgi:UDPglucose 6-dehydrogenase